MRKTQRVGKSEARTRFLPLVQSVVESGETVEITDRGRVTAVLLSHQEYLRLLACADAIPQPLRSPVGTMILDADLEDNDTTARMLLDSLEERARRL